MRCPLCVLGNMEKEKNRKHCPGELSLSSCGRIWSVWDFPTLCLKKVHFMHILLYYANICIWPGPLDTSRKPWTFRYLLDLSIPLGFLGTIWTL